MSVEIMYLNQLSQICSNLRERSDKVAIAKHFALPPDEFISWLHTINYVRNICAHHARLWNRETFYLFNKGGVDYVAKSKSGPFYRLARRMNINGVDYKY